MVNISYSRSTLSIESTVSFFLIVLIFHILDKSGAQVNF